VPCPLKSPSTAARRNVPFARPPHPGERRHRSDGSRPCANRRSWRWSESLQTGSNEQIGPGVGAENPVARSRCAFVDVMQPAQHGAGSDGAGGATDRRGRRLQCQRAVRPLPVVVRRELGRHAAQARLVEDDHVVEALPAEGADESLGDGVRPRRPDGGEQRLDADAWDWTTPPRVDRADLVLAAPIDRVGAGGSGTPATTGPTTGSHRPADGLRGPARRRGRGQLDAGGHRPPMGRSAPRRASRPVPPMGVTIRATTPRPTAWCAGHRAADRTSGVGP